MDLPEQHASENPKRLQELLAELIRTKEMKELVGGLAPEIVKVWAGGSLITDVVIENMRSWRHSGFNISLTFKAFSIYGKPQDIVVLNLFP